MENVAHLLAGLVVARAAVGWRERREERMSTRFQRYAAWTSALANNVPDGDMVLTPLTEGKLGYLLHHRGHTHTFVVGITLGLLVALGADGLSSRLAGEPMSRRDRRWLYGLGALGPVVHLLMDSWNVYGIHPFWPLDNRWFYGDTIFIVEPLLWLAAAPLLLRDTTSKIGRGLLAATALAGIGLPWVAGPIVPLGVRLGLVGFATAMAVAAWRLPRSARSFVGLGVFFLIPASFFGCGRLAEATVRQRAQSAPSDETIVDITATAWPANPLCWSTIVVSTSASGDLVLRRAVVTIAPSIAAAGSCPRPSDETTAPLEPATGTNDERVQWRGEYRVSLERLRGLASARCDVAAAMRFLRAPFVVERPNGLIVGDLRFDSGEALDFAEIDLPGEAAQCPRNVPPWEPPRARELSAAP